jgi:hypothetical protein
MIETQFDKVQAPDPRIDQLRALVRQLLVERVQAGMDCLKQGDDRASSFLQDGIDGKEAFQKLLEALGYDEEADDEEAVRETQQ